MERKNNLSLIQVTLVLMGFYFLIQLLQKYTEILVPFCMAIILSILLEPLKTLLKRFMYETMMRVCSCCMANSFCFQRHPNQPRAKQAYNEMMMSRMGRNETLSPSAISGSESDDHAGGGASKSSSPPGPHGGERGGYAYASSTKQTAKDGGGYLSTTTAKDGGGYLSATSPGDEDGSSSETSSYSVSVLHPLPANCISFGAIFSCLLITIRAIYILMRMSYSGGRLMILNFQYYESGSKSVVEFIKALSTRYHFLHEFVQHFDLEQAEAKFLSGIKATAFIFTNNTLEMASEIVLLMIFLIFLLCTPLTGAASPAVAQRSQTKTREGSRISGMHGSSTHGSSRSKVLVRTQEYLIMKLMSSFVCGALVGYWLYVMHNAFPFFLGCVCVFLKMIPTIGGVLAWSLCALFYSLDSRRSWTQIGICLTGLYVLCFFLPTLLEVRKLKRSYKVYPVIIMMWLCFFWSLFGLAGVAIAVPALAVLRIYVWVQEDLEKGCPGTIAPDNAAFFKGLDGILSGDLFGEGEPSKDMLQDSIDRAQDLWRDAWHKLPQLFRDFVVLSLLFFCMFFVG